MTSVPMLAGVVPILLLVVAGALVISALRLLRGPELVDRIIALDMLVVAAVSLAALVSMSTGRREFLDVGLGIAVIGFVATCAFAAFLENRAREVKRRQQQARATGPERRTL